MASITFDTDELIQKLVATNIPPDQARAIVHAIVDAHQNLLTREYFDYRHKEIMLYVKGLYIAAGVGAAWLAWVSVKLIAISEKIL